MTYVSIALPKRAKNLAGQVFGRLTAIAPVSRVNDQKIKWLCHCACGADSVVAVGHLNNGSTQSCGCLQRETATTHGATSTPEYSAWSHMRRRVSDPNVHHYKNYGGRGIKVCARWKKFENFIADMGTRPSPRHTIDRVNNSGNYTPENCRWATARQQANNTRRNRFLTHGGQTFTVAQWARRTGLLPGTILYRINAGWPVEKTLTASPR